MDLQRAHARALRHTVACLAAAVTWAVTGGAAASSASPPPAELFFRQGSAPQAALSPDGRQLAMATEHQGRIGLFVMDLTSDNAKPISAVTFQDIDVRSFAWVDNRQLVFNVVDLQSGLGQDQELAPGLFALLLDRRTVRTLVERPLQIDPLRIRRGLHPRHLLLHVPRAPEGDASALVDEVIVGELQVADKELQALNPLWLNVRTGESRPLDTHGAPTDVVQWWFNAQGQPRVALTRRGPRDQLHAYRLPRDGQPGRWVQLAEGRRHDLPFTPVWVGRDDDSLYVSHAAGAAGERVVAPFDFATGRPGAPWISTPGFDVDGDVLEDAPGQRILGVRLQVDTEQTVWMDPARKALQARVDQALPGRVNRISCRRCGADDAVVLVRSWSDRQPDELLLMLPPAADGSLRWRRISAAQPGLDPQHMGTKELVRIQARDGRTLPVWLTRPAGAASGSPPPAIVLVQGGGPWQRRGTWRWDPMAQFLASRGYVVIEPEVRGRAGYGRAHERAGDKQFGQAMQDDVTDALRWAQQQKIAGDKACMAGGGYGGYSTLMGLIREPALFRCGSAWFALADLMLYVKGSIFIDDSVADGTREHVLAERVGHPDRDRALLLAHSPVEQAQRIRAPLQLIWGELDRRAPSAHGRRLRQALRDAGQEPEWIEYAGEAHGLRKTGNRVDMAQRLEAFFARHLK